MGLVMGGQLISGPFDQLVTALNPAANEAFDQWLRTESVRKHGSQALAAGADTAPGPYEADVAKERRLDGKHIEALAVVAGLDALETCIFLKGDDRGRLGRRKAKLPHPSL